MRSRAASPSSRGPAGVFLLVNHAVSGLPGDFAQQLVDRLGEVGAVCDQTWTGPGLNNRSTEYEVVGVDRAA